MPLEPISEEDFRAAEHVHPYLRGRWVYLRHVARLVATLSPSRVLEVGPGPHPFVPGSDTLDISADFSPTYLHDAGATPWPVASASYDLVLALQCWEHFEGRQEAAFLEAARVAGPSGHVLISFPFRWTRTNKTHAGIGVSRIREWTAGATPVRRLLVKRPEHRKRMLMLFRGGDPASFGDQHNDQQTVQGG
jgi:SAM-dependent methyltransferase